MSAKHTDYTSVLEKQPFPCHSLETGLFLLLLGYLDEYLPSRTRQSSGKSEKRILASKCLSALYPCCSPHASFLW